MNKRKTSAGWNLRAVMALLILAAFLTSACGQKGQTEQVQETETGEAAEEAAKLGKVIFLTTGSRNLSKFTVSPHLQDCRLIARVLPTAEVIGLCEEMGLAPDQIVALQGPFSAALNRELFLRYGAEVIVTKNSGTLGGTDTKLQAAAELGLPLIVIDRPPLAYDCLCSTFEELRKKLQNLLKEDA